MAHIPDGVLSAPVLTLGAVVTAGMLAVALRRLDDERLPQTAVLAATFFVASLISIPLGPSSVHLLLNGLMGLLLGWMAVPALFVALMLQAVFFGFGGLVVLGVNTMNLALPALFCAAALRAPLRRADPPQAWLIGTLAGVAGVLLTGVAVALSLALSGKPFVPAAKTLVVISLPLAVVEGLITATIVSFLLRVAPELVFHTETNHDESHD
ncbi:Energy-coupling factor transporter probable substrate-capture protein NikMN [Thiorhodovibrio winogradskyi]|uniref:Energy-coupling factor transporter probable substrate-capture protein NikMN n=1 Tax=Thiorhodovibrio winogradskyi TaxID=77007 RepID=A0ABZ0S7B4_9GAMM|nr:cobalt transporter CbiM [Thiorhodovibrio winogradskyi]